MVKSEQESRGPGRPPSPEGQRKHILGIRGREAYKAWLAEFAEHCRLDMVDVVDHALEAYARERGFKAPPKR